MLENPSAKCQARESHDEPLSHRRTQVETSKLPAGSVEGGVVREVLQPRDEMLVCQVRPLNPHVLGQLTDLDPWPDIRLLQAGPDNLVAAPFADNREALGKVQRQASRLLRARSSPPGGQRQEPWLIQATGGGNLWGS